MDDLLSRVSAVLQPAQQAQPQGQAQGAAMPQQPSQPQQQASPGGDDLLSRVQSVLQPPAAQPQAPQRQIVLDGDNNFIGWTIDGQNMTTRDGQHTAVPQGSRTQAIPEDTFWNRLKTTFTPGTPALAYQMFDPDKPKMTGQEVAKGLEGAGIGAAKGLGQTGTFLLRIPSKLGLPTDPQSEAQLNKWDEALKPQGEDQKAGATMESILEFALGDEALKGLSLAEKLGKGSQIAKFLEQYPRLANVLGASVRGAAAGGAVGGVHGGEEGAVQGAEFGGLGGGAVAAAGEVPGLVSQLKAGAAQAEAVSGAGADTVAAANAAKAPIAAGQPALTEAPTLSSVQPEVQGAIRDSANQIAKGNGLQEIPETASVRDVYKELGDQFYARSKAQFRQVEQATGVDLDGLQTKIDAVQEKIDASDLLGDDTSKLEARKFMYEGQAEAAFDKAGDQFKQAKSDWKQYNASYDAARQVRMGTDGRAGIGSGEMVDPNKVAPRFQKLADSNSPTQPGRLQQLAGEDNANSLLNRLEGSRGAIRDFKPSTATGQKALQDMLQANTGTGRLSAMKQAIGFSPKTDWIGAYKDFNATSPQELVAKFGSEAPAAKAFLKGQARWQVAKMIGYGMTAYGIAKATGLKLPLIHALLE